MFKNINVYKIVLALLMLLILVASIIKYNNGKDLSKLLDDFIANENYTDYHISFSISDKDNNSDKFYSSEDKEIILEVLNYFKGLKPIKIYNDLYLNEDNEEKELNNRYSIYIRAYYYTTQKKENYTLKEQKTDDIFIHFNYSNKISVNCDLDTDYKENYDHDYRLNQNIDEIFIYNIIEKYNLKDTSRD